MNDGLGRLASQRKSPPVISLSHKITILAYSLITYSKEPIMNFAFKLKTLCMATGLLAGTWFGSGALAVQTIDAGIPEYTRVSGISGNLSSIGSDTLSNLMTLWAEAFNRYYPNVNVQIQSAGSSTAPPALTEGTSNFGPMSRYMKDNELEAFEKKFGYKPTAIPVAVDALAIFVHKDNPIEGLSIPQVDAIFSTTRKCGQPGDIRTWGDLGIKPWATKSIQLFGRNSVSGTYGYFKENALCKGDFKNTVNEQPGSGSVVQSVTTSRNGMGYSGFGYMTAGVKTVPLAKKDTKDYVAATPENALSGKYPLARQLIFYVNKRPNQPLPPLEREFIKMVLSKTGQELVVRSGYIPLPWKIIQKTLKNIE